MCMTSRRPDIDPRGKYNTTEAARVLGVARSTIQRWRNKGLIKPRVQKHCLRPRYLGSDLLAFWDSDIRSSR
ncbi:MAG: helix-turn-helix domain-containing protein [Muribaculaceae bacterium]|nr:helix-turn-helix domain-containing protein [Muribaculaceae bacterium]